MSALSRIKSVVDKAKEEWAFASEPSSSPDYGKSREEWKAAKDAQKGAEGGK